MAAAAGETVGSDEEAQTPPTADEIARRGQLRGLGEELMRVDAETQLARRPEFVPSGIVIPFRCRWFISLLEVSFLQTTAPDLYRSLSPFNDATLMEAHGEEFLELVINKAPDDQWSRWLHRSLEVAAGADNICVFRRLFALCKNDRIFWAWLYREDGGGFRLLRNTAARGSAEVLSAILEFDSFLAVAQDVSRANRCRTALWAAAHEGQRSCVALLIKAGAPLEHTALTIAVEKGHEGVVLELLAAGADVDNIEERGVQIRPSPRNNPLCIAAARSNERMVGILLAAGAGLGENRTNTLALIIAAEAGCCGSMERLLAAGADVNVVNSRGQSALYKACEWIRDGAVKLLLQHKANLTSRCNEGRWPCDVVGTGPLNSCQRLLSHVPFTLNAVQTAGTDRICGMLRRASAWGRRGWLVILRARRLAAAELLDESSLEKTTTAEQAPPGNIKNDKAKEPRLQVDAEVCKAVEGLTLADAPSTATPGEFGDPAENKTVFTKEALLPCKGHGSGEQAEHDGGWECAVEWLLHCPDERGIFREILGFL